MSAPGMETFPEPFIDQEVIDSFRALPTEDELPCDDGEPMETARHRDQMILLIESLKAYWSARTDYYVGGNMFVHYALQPTRQFRGPDFFLVREVDGTRERKSWVVWQEGMRFPNVIIELLSDSTRRVDKEEKKDLYAHVFHTAEYYLYDPFSYELTGYRLHCAEYEEVTADQEGKIFSPVTGLYLGRRGEWLRWITPEGMVLPTPWELAQQEGQRAEQERQRAEQERQRAEQEGQRAEQERQRAEHAERLLEEYRRRFGRLE